VIAALHSQLSGAITASSSGKYFGFVTGGTLPAALAADWLVSAYDQNTWSAKTAPACAAIEDIAVQQLIELLGLPSTAAGTLCGGATIASIIALAAARDAVLTRSGWDAQADGLNGAPRINIAVGGEAHSSVLKALTVVGLGKPTVTLPVLADGSIDCDQLRAVPPPEAPAIIVLQAGHVNTGSFDDFNAISAWACGNAWIHVDGAFGLWANASSDAKTRELVAGVSKADSWATDLHKMLSCPYDNALVVIKDKEAANRAMTCAAPYLAGSGGNEWRPNNLTPELQNSRRGRGVVAYAALQSLGKLGVAQQIDGCVRRCRLLVRLVLEKIDSVGVVVCMNDVVFNQALLQKFKSHFRPRIHPHSHSTHKNSTFRFQASCCQSSSYGLPSAQAAPSPPPMAQAVALPSWTRWMSSARPSTSTILTPLNTQ
jgi:glutamate/tyrosine decarboxylase-like PLP-dependent enzyme